jgi:DNA-binding NarL/FixJ family response regulator
MPRRAAEDPRVARLTVGSDELLVISLPGQWSPPLPPLTPAERAVLAALLRGESRKAIARRRGTSHKTIANQISSLFRKLAVGSVAELVAATSSR